MGFLALAGGLGFRTLFDTAYRASTVVDMLFRGHENPRWRASAPAFLLSSATGNAEN